MIRTGNKNTRIAIVLLHGIGEQRPMATLREFVQFVFDKPGLSKPDRASELFEVRRLNVEVEPTVDGKKVTFECHELYWAHLMHSSAAINIAKWMWRLLWIPRAELRSMARHLCYRKHLYTRTQMAAIAACASLLVAVVFGPVSFLADKLTWLNAQGGAAALLIALGSVILRFAFQQMVDVVGDAARYLDNAPANVGVRQEIRSECVRFLRKLNADGYSRIVVIGHSLGSVIAYDALRLLWASMPEHAMLPASAAKDGGLLNWLHGGSEPHGEPAISPQNALFEQRLPDTQRRWKISDLITIGSPLAHAPLLLASSMTDFNGMKHQRELPTCPPTKDKPESPYCTYPASDNAECVRLHHAAIFAVTRWTNFYFLSDPIGGPLHDILGDGINDVELLPAPRNAWSDHVRYWGQESRIGGMQFKGELRKILGLTGGATQPDQAPHSGTTT